MIGEERLLVTLKSDRIRGPLILCRCAQRRDRHRPSPFRAPPARSAVGFAVYPDGTAIVTLAHSNQDGLFRNGGFRSVVDAGQAAPCWMTRVGKYVFTAIRAAGRSVV